MIKKKTAGIYKVESINVDLFKKDPFIFNRDPKKVSLKQVEELAKNTESCYRLTRNNEVFNERTYKNDRFVLDEYSDRKAVFRLTPQDPPLYQAVVEKPGYFVDEIVLGKDRFGHNIKFSRTGKNVSFYVSPVFTYIPDSEKPIQSVKFEEDKGYNVWNRVWLDGLKATLDEPLFDELSSLKSSELLKLSPSWKWRDQNHGLIEEISKDTLCKNESIEFIFIDKYTYEYGPSKRIIFDSKKQYSLGVDFIARQGGQYMLKHLDIKNKTTKPTDPDFENSPLELNLSEVARFDKYFVLDTNTVAFCNDGAKNYEDYTFYQGGKLVTDREVVKEVFINNLTSIALSSDLFGDALRMQGDNFPFMTQEDLFDCFLEVLNRNDHEDTSTLEYRDKYNGQKIYNYNVNKIFMRFKDNEELLLKVAKTPRFASRIICEKAKGGLNPQLEDLFSNVFCALKKNFVKVMQNPVFLQNLHDKREKDIAKLREVQKQVADVMQNPELSEKMFKTGKEECDAKTLDFLNKMGVKCIAGDSDSLVHTFDENHPILLLYNRWKPQNCSIYLLDEDGDKKDFIKFDVYAENARDPYNNKKEVLRYRKIRHVDTLNAADKVTLMAQEVELPEYWRDFFGTPKDMCEFFYQVENADGSKGYFVEQGVEAQLADDYLKLPRKIETDFRIGQGDLTEIYTDFKNEQFEIARLEREFLAEQAEYERQLEDQENENIALLNEDDGKGAGDNGSGEAELPF